MKRNLILFTLCALLSAGTAGASSILFKRIDTGAGLSYSLINAIGKDSEGFMWFCTASGLNRYDGYRFKVYRNVVGDSTSLPNNYVLGMVEMADGKFWIKTSAGYTLMDAATERFTHDLRPFMQRLGSQGTPTEVRTDSLKQTLWLYVAGEGCYRYDTRSRQHRFLSIADGGLPANDLSDLTEAGRQLLLTYDDGTIACLDKTTLHTEWINHDIPTLTASRTEVYSCYVDNEQCAWVYGVPGLWVYDLRRRQWRDDLKSLTHFHTQDFIHAITQGGDGRIWIGLDYSGIEVIDKQARTTTLLQADPKDERSLPHNTVYSLYTDPDGLVWVGTYKKGVAYYGKSLYKFGFYDYGDITCVEEETSTGDLWLGTNDRGLLRVNREKHTEESYSTENGRLPSNVVVSLLRATDGKLWVGMFHGGICCYDGNRTTSFRASKGSNALSNDNVWALAEDPEGNIWIGTLGGGLQCYTPKKKSFTTYHIDNSALKDNYIASLCMGSDQTLIVGTASNGIALMDLPTRKIVYACTKQSSGEALVNDYINQVYEDSRRLVWIGTREGISVFDRNRNKMIPHPIGHEMNDPVSAITEDKEGNLWISSTRQLVRVKVERENDSLHFRPRTYGTKDGLQRGDFNLRSIKTLRSGAIVAGGLYGINVFNPTAIRYNRKLPRVMFTSLALFGQEVHVGKEYGKEVVLPRTLGRLNELKLSYKQNIVGISFASDNFELPEETSYAYLLEGVNGTWLTLPPGTHDITFTNLNPGHYTLRVKAINSDGYEGTDEARLGITVLPPLWRSATAYVLYTLLAIALLIAARHRILEQERKKYQLRQLEQEGQQREEMNQMKFRFFTNISHELRTPLTLIISPLEALLKEENNEARKNTLALMYRNAQRLLQLVNQLLDFRKGEMSNHRLSLAEGDIIGFVRSTCHSFLSLAQKRNIQFSFLTGEELLTMAFDADKIGKTVVNLLSNAFKYTPEGGRVSVALERIQGEEEVLEIKVTDTGIGISDEDKPHVFDRFFQADRKGMEETTGTGIGLSLVHDFVALHGGSVEVFDNIGNGSVFVVHLPVAHIETVHPLPATEEVEEPPIEEDTEKPQAPPKEVKEKKKEKERERPLILVVDDNEDFRLFMQQSLELYYQVESAANGKQAWEAMTQELPDLVLCDVMMPEMDGNELCRLMKQEKRTAHIPVILLTAKQATESKLEGLQTGADDYVTKPFSMDILLLRIGKLIEWRKNREEITPTIDPSPDNIAITSMDEKLVQKAIRYVEENLQNPELSVELMSRELGMSRIRLYKKLLQITGRTPIEFIRLIRLKRAAQLLRESQMFVSEVAYEVGFGNPKYFSRYFKEEFGELPT
ncbi:MAG: response regulator, partial [Mediterranea sp.]|nr:response regulator [Mediterranea sp.]